MILIFDNYRSVNDKLLKEIIDSLPESRKKKALLYKHQTDRISCAVSYKLLEYGMKNVYNINRFALTNSNMGKPYIKDHSEIKISISHCKFGCACIISNKDVGIDIQDLRPINAEIIERVCSEAEYKSIANAEDSLSEFIKIWAMKESYLKMLGIGISTDLKRIDTTVLKSKIVCREFEKYIVAVATEGEIEDAKVQLDHAAEKHLELAEIL